MESWKSFMTEITEKELDTLENQLKKQMNRLINKSLIYGFGGGIFAAGLSVGGLILVKEFLAFEFDLFFVSITLMLSGMIISFLIPLFQRTEYND